MKPGRELDRLVGVKVMGWRVLSHWDADGTIKHLIDENQCEVRPPQFKPYSTNIAAAWEVVEKMKQMDAQFELSYLRGTSSVGETPYRVLFIRGNTGSHHGSNSAPYGICLAALEFIGHPLDLPHENL